MSLDNFCSKCGKVMRIDYQDENEIRRSCSCGMKGYEARKALRTKPLKTVKCYHCGKAFWPSIPIPEYSKVIVFCDEFCLEKEKEESLHNQYYQE